MPPPAELFVPTLDEITPTKMTMSTTRQPTAVQLVALLFLFAETTGGPGVGKVVAGSIGAPHPGQTGALFDTCLPHSGQLIRAILVPMIVRPGRDWGQSFVVGLFR